MTMQTWRDVGINLPQGASGDVKTTCPKCSHTRTKQHDPCLSVNVEEGVWNCHHCGWAGSLRNKRQEPRAERVYTRPKFDVSLLNLPKPVIARFQERGINPETLSKAGVGFEKGAILFPFRKGGEVVNIKHRAQGKKFWQEKDAEPCFYNHDGAAKAVDKKRLVIVEGEFDALSCIEAGIEAVVSVPSGAPSPTAKNYAKEFAYLENEEDFLAGFHEVVLAVDNDDPGQVLERELARRIGQEKCLRVAYPSGCKDLNDVLKAQGVQGVKTVVYGAKPCPIDGLYTVGQIRRDVMRLYREGLRPGLSTGWRNLDEHYTVRPGEMTILTGIPSHGKSNFLDSLMVNLYRLHSWSFAIYSPENWPLERHAANIAEKLLQKRFDKSSELAPRMSEGELSEVMDLIDEYFNFVMLPEEEIGIDNILSRARSAVYRFGVKGIVLDPWNEIDHDRPNDMKETDWISKTLGKIRRFARVNDVHIWVVAHPTKMRKQEGSSLYEVPTMYDISGSAHFYNKADNGLTVYRHFDRSETSVYVQKVRFREVGSPGVAEFTFCRDTGTYYEKE